MINLNTYINAKFTPVSQEENPELWKKLRTTGIGGSDAGAIMGLNQYSSPLVVYMQKKMLKGSTETHQHNGGIYLKILSERKHQKN